MHPDSTPADSVPAPDPSPDDSPTIDTLTADDPTANRSTTEAASIEETAEPAPGYVAGPAPVPVGGAPRRISGVLVGVAIALVALIGGSGLFLSGYALGSHQAGQPGTSASDDAAFKPFWDAYHNVVSKFALGPIDKTKLVEGSIKGMVESLGDPYSSYLSPEDFKNTLSDISGQFEGIGAEIGTVDANGKLVDCTTFGPNCRLEVSKPLDNSPALKAGLKPGDVITKIDGASTDGLTPDTARNKIRGPAGTSVVLDIERAGSQPFSVTITRAKIQRQEVTTQDLANGSLGYARLEGFSEDGADKLVAAIKADVAKGQKKIILDLRGNPGGFVDAATRVASAFVGTGPIFWQQDANGTQTETSAIPGGSAVDPSIRVVVLVDHGSASASEIVTGALKDTHRATVVGETTFGKGTVQTWFEVGNNGDQGGVKLTIAKWLTPNKTWIHHVGISPDVPVTVPDNLPAGADPALDKAVEVLGAPVPSPAPSSSLPASSPAGSPAPSSLEPSPASSRLPQPTSGSLIVRLAV
jgi:carboxyl-terminal processing protease